MSNQSQYFLLLTLDITMRKRENLPSFTALHLRCPYLKRFKTILNKLAWNNTSFSKFKMSWKIK